LRSLVANIFLLQAFDFSCPPLFWCNTFWNEPAWSIGVEFIIYSIFPFILFALLKTKFKADAIIYIATLIATFLLIKFTRGTLSTIVGIPGIFRCGLECVLGILTYKIYRWNEQRQYLDLNLISIFSLGLIILIMHTWSDRFRGFHDWSILPAFSLLILSTADRDNGLIPKLMSSQVLMYLGTISYSIYMVHWCLAELVKFFWLCKFNVAFGSGFDTTQSLIALGLFIPIVLLVASFTYHWIEVPARKFLKPKPQFSG
jgi:peptidoglycan/LPS O-acetylase OafA/YrhL